GLFYPEQKKIVPEFLVEQITPRMIALWYCGDGTLQTGTAKWKEKTYQRRPRAGLYTNAFGDHPESRDRINRIFSRFEITPRWRQCGEYQVLDFSVSEAKKLFELIAPFVPKPMEYKLPEAYRDRYHQSKPQQSRQSQILRPMRIKEIRTRIPYRDGQRIGKQRFDISVADNHNYLVDGCLVSNSPETTPGGKALKFYTSVRLDIRRIAQIKKGDEVVGGRHRVKVVKNKVAAPFRTTEFDLIYNEGISREGELLALGEKYGLIQKSGASYTYLPPGGDKSAEVKLGRGYDAARTTLRQEKKLASELLKHIKTAMKEDGR
ncbi:MAG: recombinase RecA, partial [bacterium]|nr:recombinase RecA [bacterium]